MPDVEHKATLIDDPELEIKLDRRWELKEAKDEFDNLDKEIKESLKEKPEVIIGKWEILGKWVEKQMKPTEAKTIRYWETRIRQIGG